MPPERARKITRNRQALSCIPCRQRKVRCGKEHPSCESCLKIGEQCVYGTTAPKEKSSTPTGEIEIPPQPKSESNPLESSKNVNTGAAVCAASIPSDAARDFHVNPSTAAPGQPVSVDQRLHGSPNQTQALLEEARQLKIQDAPIASSYGHLSLRDPLRPRYTESSFWALIEGQETLCDNLFPQNYTKRRHNCPERFTDDHIEMCALMASCKDVPPRPICDMLLHGFLVGVQPIYPLIDEVSFIAKYNVFWEWCGSDLSKIPGEEIHNDHSFLVLLFAVLYCGAITTTEESWISPFLQEISKPDFDSKLKALLSGGLVLCRYTRHPTFNTLVALLLSHSCAPLDGEPLNDSHFVGLVLRMAQSLGLHRESAVAQSSGDSELRRRVWWHIVWLDVQASLINGLPVNFGGSSGQSDTAMIRCTLSNGMSKALMCKVSELPPPTSEGGNSSFVIFTIGRYETAKFEHHLFELLHGTRALMQADLDALLGDIRRLHSRLSELIAMLPVEGIPERGFMPSKVANATPITHKPLYGDHTNEPTVFTSWARIMLTMFKTESAILLQKSFLGRPYLDKEQADKLWYRTVQLCLAYLRTYLQLAGTKSFSPYRWFPTTRLPPILPILILLIHLRRDSVSPVAKMVRYFIDEILGNFLKEETSRPDSPFGPNVVDQAWTFLRALRTGLDSTTDLNSFVSTEAQIMSPWQDYNQRSPFGSATTAAMPILNNGFAHHDTTLDISNLEAWSSSVVGVDAFPPLSEWLSV